MKINLIISAVVFLVALLYIGHLHISIKPFSVSLPYWHRSVGVLLMLVGIYVFSIGEHVSGYIKGLKDGENDVIEILNEKGNKP